MIDLLYIRYIHTYLICAAGRVTTKQQTSVSLFFLHPTSQLCLMSLGPATAINSLSVMHSDFNPSSSLICFESSPDETERERCIARPVSTLLRRASKVPEHSPARAMSKYQYFIKSRGLWWIVGERGRAVINHSLSLYNQPNGHRPWEASRACWLLCTVLQWATYTLGFMNQRKRSRKVWELLWQWPI